MESTGNRHTAKSRRSIQLPKDRVFNPLCELLFDSQVPHQFVRSYGAFSNLREGMYNPNPHNMVGSDGSLRGCSLIRGTASSWPSRFPCLGAPNAVILDPVQLYRIAQSLSFDPHFQRPNTPQFLPFPYQFHHDGHRTGDQSSRERCTRNQHTLSQRRVSCCCCCSCPRPCKPDFERPLYIQSPNPRRPVFNGGDHQDKRCRR